MLGKPNLMFMQKIFVGILLSVSFIFLLVPISVVFSKNPSEQDKSAALGGLAIGVPALVGGLSILKGSRDKQQKLIAERTQLLETTFLELLQTNDGQVTVINFAIATNLSLEEAKQYLDRKASQLNGDFKVLDDGKISYYFHL